MTNTLNQSLIQKIKEIGIKRYLSYLLYFWFVATCMVIALIAVQAVYEPRSTKELTGEVKPVGLSEKECYLEAIWYESRNQGYAGMHKVAEVINNRTKSGLYPNSACEVVKQDKQFSYRNDWNIPVGSIRIPYKPSEYEVYTQALLIAEKASKDDLKPSMPRDVLWYAKTGIKNRWIKTMQKVQQYKDHVFYAKKNKDKQDS
jgi:spore germination cell wall hydrolase CwlJ-like protein